MKKNPSPDLEPVYHRIPAYLIGAFLALLALIAIPVVFSPEGAAEELLGGSITDFCMSGREVILFILAVVILLWFAGERIFPEKPLRSVLCSDRDMRVLLILCGGYFLWALMSTLISGNRSVGFLGFPTVLEGLAAVFGYMVIFLGGFEYFSGEKPRRLLRWILAAALGIIGVMAVIDLSAGPLAELLFGFTDKRPGMSLLFGNSTVSAEVCVLLFLPGLAVAFDEETLWKRILFGALSGAALLGVICSNSSAAFMTLPVCAGVLVIFTLAARKASLIRVAAALISCLIPLGIFTAIAPDRVSHYICVELHNGSAFEPEGSYGIEEINVDLNTLTLAGEGKSMQIEINGGALSFTAEGEPMNSSTEGSLTRFSDSGYEMVSVEKDGNLVLVDLGYEDKIPFEVTGDVFQYIDTAGYLSEITPTRFTEYSRYFGLVSGRGYIWLQTLPLLKDRLIFGAGAGGFPFIFPQNDAAGLLRTHGALILTAKPHCMYLQIFTEYGLPALLMFAAIAVVVLVRGVKGSWRSGSALPAGLTMAWLAWLVMGVVNDSAVPFSIWAWFLAGVLLTFERKNMA